MAKDIHEEPFDDATLTKLEIFERYLVEWLPVFVMQRYQTIYIVDFFAGPGKDKDGKAGSPLRIIDCVLKYRKQIEENGIRMEVIFNELDIDKCHQLHENTDSVKDKLFYKPTIYNKDFKELFFELKPELESAPSLIFIDQNGISQVTREILIELNNFKRTDFLFFISSSFFIRFCDNPSFKKYFPNICGEELKEANYNSIHRQILEHYRGMFSSGSPLRLYPFSIKKFRNIYGLIFGTKHILGADKFLDITWKKNPINGEANFDIDEDIKKEQRVLFAEFKKKTKLDEFENMLTVFISERKILTNKDIYDFTLGNGFIHDHAVEIVKRLIKEGKLRKNYDGKGLYIGYNQCYKEQNRKEFEWIG